MNTIEDCREEAEKEEVILEFINSNMTPIRLSEDYNGIHVIPYGEVYIVLETRKYNPNRYLAWVTLALPDNKTVPKVFQLAGRYGKWNVWQLKSDYN